MSGETGRPSRWIVQGADVAAGKLSSLLAAAEITQVEQVAPDVVVLAMTESRAERLKQQFPELIVEADAELDPFG